MRAGSLLFLLLAGCATVESLLPGNDPALEQQVRQTFRESFPQPAKLMQRAIVTVAGRQFSCDGLLQVAADGSARLAMLAPVGVMAEVRVRPDEVLRTAPSFPRSWAQEHVITVVRLVCPGSREGWKFGRLANGQPVLTNGRTIYVFSTDGRQWLEAQSGAVRAAPGRVTGPGYEVELRTVSQ
jgi:hypothetical protein